MQYFVDVGRILYTANVIALVIVCIILLFFIFLDVNYFIQFTAYLLYAKLFMPNRKLNDPISIYGFSSAMDIDITKFCMNKANYFRVLDFARYVFWERTGLFAFVTECRGQLELDAFHIEHRLIIPLFTLYRIDTKLLYWDDKAFYLEHRFVSPYNEDAIYAVVLSKQSVVGTSIDDMMKKLVDSDYQKPALSPELNRWLLCLETSNVKQTKSE